MNYEIDTFLLSNPNPVSYTHLRAHETRHDLVCRLLLEKKNTSPSPRDRQKCRMPSSAFKHKKKNTTQNKNTARP